VPIKNIFNSSDSKLNIFSLLAGLLIFISPFLHFYSINVLESVFNKTLFLKFSLFAITIIVALAVPVTFIVSHYLLRTAFYRLFPIFYVGFFSIFLILPFRYLLLNLSLPPYVKPIVICAIFVLLLLWMFFRLSKVREFHSVALIFALVLIVGPIVRIVNATLIVFDHGAKYSSDSNSAWVTKILKQRVNPAILPNIYFVVPDAYTSVAVLRDVLNFDNGPFIRELENRGLIHLPDSRSSYLNTIHTIASLLQADYPFTEDSPRYRSSDDLYPAILYRPQPPLAIKVARHLGYTVSIIGNFVADCGGPHVYCHEGYRQWIPYEIQQFFEMTPLLRLLRKINPTVAFSDVNSVDTISRARRYLSSPNRLKGPYFMLIHHMSPHPPFLYEADCRVRSGGLYDVVEGDKRAIRSGYLDNLQCTNKKLIEFVDYIAGADPSALIAIQADHGISGFYNGLTGAAFKDIPENVIRETVSVLSLVRVPEECRKWLRPDLNTVNTVRFLFSCAAGTEPVYLENKSYASFNTTHPDFGYVYRVRD
jgi:hypothetical protein